MAEGVCQNDTGMIAEENVIFWGYLMVQTVIFVVVGK